MMDSPRHEDAISGTSTVVATEDQVSADLEGEVVILSLGSGTYYSLDEVGAYIWSLIQEPRSVSEIRDAVLEEYEVQPDRCERDLEALLRQLASAGIVEITNGPTG